MSLIVNGKTMLGFVPGVGVPKGGEEGQLLVKSGAKDYKTEWKNPTEAIPYYSNQNLLDNWYFVGGGSQQDGGQFPINQRGGAEYSGSGYTIDRWKVSGTLKLSLNDEYLRIEKTALTGDPYFYQPIENYKELIGKTVTVSMLYRANCDGFRIASGTNLYDIPKSADWNLFSTTFSVSANASANSVLWIQFSDNITNADNYFDIKAVKLEVGDTQTLAHKEGDTWVLNDPPPNYALELEKCQRHFIRLTSKYRYSSNTSSYLAQVLYIGGTTWANFIISLPVIMRSKPTLRHSGVALDGTSQEINSTSGINLNGVIGNILYVSLNTGYTLSAPAYSHYLLLRYTGYFDIDCNL